MVAKMDKSQPDDHHVWVSLFQGLQQSSGKAHGAHAVTHGGICILILRSDVAKQIQQEGAQS